MMTQLKSKKRAEGIGDFRWGIFDLLICRSLIVIADLRWHPGFAIWDLGSSLSSPSLLNQFGQALAFDHVQAPQHFS